jgi:deoxycytidine triphosphate deaminase
MSLLSYDELMALVARGVITGVDPDYVNATSIDITIGNKILYEDNSGGMQSYNHVVLKDRKPLAMIEWDLEKSGPFDLHPRQFILAQSAQTFNLPNDISCEYKLKSSMARIGINHCLAGWCDAGWNGSVLTLEFMNVTTNHIIQLNPGDKIGQMIFFSHRMVPDDRSYAARGRYNNDKEVKGIKE